MRKGKDRGDWWANLKSILDRFRAKRAQRRGDYDKAERLAKRARELQS